MGANRNPNKVLPGIDPEVLGQSLDSKLSALRSMPLMRRFKDNAGVRPAWAWAAGLLESRSWPVFVWHVLDTVAYLIAFHRPSGLCVA